MVNSRVISTFAACCLLAYASDTSYAQNVDGGVDQRPRNPIVRVVAVSQDGLQGKFGETIIAATLTRLDRAASFHPDVACLPESF
ncbi:MAG: hypothetical protein ACYTG0_28285, partial [Planctomycetota bacterium]